MKSPNNGLAQQRSGLSSRGIALIEALVASAVLSIGLAGATRLTLHTLQAASDTRQHALAHILAIDAMDCLQSDRAFCHIQQVTTLQGTDYTVKSALRPRPGLAMEDIEVQVLWPTLGRTHASGNLASGTETNQRTEKLVLHGSRDHVPAWVGVSLP